MTLSELIECVETRAEEAWNHTAAIMAMIAEVNRNPKVRGIPYTPAEFHPLHKGTAKKNAGEPLTVGVLDSIVRSIRARKKREGKS